MSKIDDGPNPTAVAPLRVMSGMRTTAPRLHIGNYFGALKNWLKLQNEYTCFFGAMDWHALTTAYRSTKEVAQWRRDIIAEWVAWGLKPEKCVIFIQSQVPEHIELFAYFAMMTPLGWLDRVPTWKDSEEEAKATDTHNLGRFGYPVLQAADIALYRGNLVPVGKDQASHLEISREIIRRFNGIYKTKLPEPQPLFTDIPVLPGTDGRKMGKSNNNVFDLTQEENEIRKNVNQMVTDPRRVRREDPGEPTDCSVYGYHKLFSKPEDLPWVEQGCRTAGIGCGDCKGLLIQRVNELVSGPREKKKELLKDTSRLDSIIAKGCGQAREEASRTLQQIKKKTGF